MSGGPLSTGDVLRLIIKVTKSGDVFIPEGSTEPTWRAIAPSNGDEEEADERKLPVRVSVWDLGKTKESEAIGHRPDKETFSYVASVDALRSESGKHGALGGRVSVVPDPCKDVHEAGGCDGHCGIEGMDRPSGASKSAWRSMLTDLAKLFKPICRAR